MENLREEMVKKIQILMNSAIMKEGLIWYRNAKDSHCLVNECTQKNKVEWGDLCVWGAGRGLPKRKATRGVRRRKIKTLFLHIIIWYHMNDL